MMGFRSLISRAALKVAEIYSPVAACVTVASVVHNRPSIVMILALAEL